MAEADPFRPEFAYIQVADAIQARVLAGEITGQLPSELELARALGVSYHTLRRGIAVLRERGHVVTLHGRGNFVAPPERRP